MRGRILDYSFSESKGVITTEENQRYTFSSLEWKEKETPKRGMTVDFDTTQPGRAIDVYLALPDKSETSLTAHSTKPKSHIWVSIVALVLALLAFLAFFDDGYWDEDMVIGLGLFITISLAAGIVVITNDFAGRGMAIAAVIISSLSLVLGIGLLIS